MKWIRFEDPMTDTFITCKNILKNRLGWISKALVLSTPGEFTRVYYYKKLRIEIYVLYIGKTGENGKKQYYFLYKNGAVNKLSYPFEFIFLYWPEIVNCIDTHTDYVYNVVKEVKMKKEWVDRAERIEKEGERMHIKTDYHEATVYDNVADMDGHKECVSSDSYHITYEGINPDTNQRVYTFTRNDYNIDKKFEILGTW